MTDPITRLNAALSDRYRIESEIGSGGMATVYLAQDRKHDRKVAVKVMKPELAAVVGAERFLSEIKVTANLQHPHILPLHDSGEADGFLYYVMPFVEGESLRQKLDREQQLPVEEALKIAGHLAEALQSAHQLGVVHRDIKPENILLREGLAIVADFGVALAVGGAGGGRLTATGISLGTPVYMSPEQAAGESGIDARSDIYSLGCVLYEMLAGAPPFTGTSAQAVLAKHIADPVPPLTTVRPSVPPRVASAIHMALGKSRADRFGSVKSFSEALFAEAPGAEEQARSIAVLPFANVSPDPENDYFADGMTDEVISALSRRRNLRVAARTSAFAFKGQSLPVTEVGKRLNVSVVLEGSFRRAGNRLRLMVQLTNVADGFTLWSERYDRPVADVFETQDELTDAIVSRLGAELGDEPKPPSPARPKNLAAYDLFLRGRFHWNRMSPEGYEKALQCFEGALEIEPGYARAYAGAAAAHAYAIHLEGRKSSEIAARGKEAARKALELDERLEEAHAALGYILWGHDWDWDGAEASFQRALELHPNSAYAHYLYSIFLGNVGRFEEAIIESERSVDLDPLWAQASQNLGWWYHNAGRLAEARAALERALELQPDFPLVRLNLGLHLLADEPERGLEELELASAASEGAPIARCFLAYACGKTGKRDRARRMLDELHRVAAETYVSEVFFAIIHLGLKEHEEAIRWLEKGYEQRTGAMVWCAHLEMFEPLREDPRFSSLMRRMGLRAVDPTPTARYELRP